jgi:hypothetical protein
MSFDISAYYLFDIRSDAEREAVKIKRENDQFIKSQHQQVTETLHSPL